MAKEYIEREAALAALCRDCDKIVPANEREPCCYRFTGCMEYYNIFELPTADVRPVVRGRWVHGEHGPYCSNCDGYPPTRKRLGHPGDTEFDYTKFCPNCGAQMEAGDDP